MHRIRFEFCSVTYHLSELKTVMSILTLLLPGYFSMSSRKWS